MSGYWLHWIISRNKPGCGGQRLAPGALLGFALLLLHGLGMAQTAAPVPTTDGVTQSEVSKLLQAIERTQVQIDISQHDLQALRVELTQMQSRLAGSGVMPQGGSSQVATSASGTGAAGGFGEAGEGDMRANQIATLDQVKVESESKYPLRVTGTLLLNGFVNSTRVDQAAAPTSALGGRGSTGLSVQQIVLGLDADGPHLFGARSRADLRVDFFGSSEAQSYAGASGLLRLRTAHAVLGWRRTEIFASLDRPLINPHSPESLVAVAQPELAWSGNLWSWSPQIGVSHTLGTRTRFRMQAALIDPADPIPVTSSTQALPGAPSPNSAERSRRPGVLGRVAVLGGDDERSAEFGMGGYLSPHYEPKSNTSAASSYEAWAATLDYRLPLSHGLNLSGNVYRGQALGGLGAGGYKDYVYRVAGTSLAVRPLEDVGGWSQLHQKLNEAFSWNVGFGIDNAFSKELRTAAVTTQQGVYGNIARNRTIFANVLYSPSAYLLLSVEYRHLYTAPVVGPLWLSHTTGVGAAYRF